VNRDTPIAIDRIDRTRGDGDLVRWSLTGRRLAGDAIVDEPLLVVSVYGRRHRFQASRDGHGAPPPPGVWAASFAIPFWAEPTRSGQASLWLGDVAIAVPLPGEAPARTVPAGPDSGSAQDAGPSAADDEGDPGPAASAPRDAIDPDPAASAPRDAIDPGPAASAPGDAIDPGPAASAPGDAIDPGLEHDQLLAAIASQREDFERRLAEAGHGRRELESRIAGAEVARDAALSEAGSLRVELERVGTELAVVRERLGAQDGGLAEAETLLAEAQALSTELRAGNSQSATI
jgi:hypothetical protein